MTQYDHKLVFFMFLLLYTIPGGLVRKFGTGSLLTCCLRSMVPASPLPGPHQLSVPRSLRRKSLKLGILASLLQKTNACCCDGSIAVMESPRHRPQGDVKNALVSKRGTAQGAKLDRYATVLLITPVNMPLELCDNNQGTAESTVISALIAHGFGSGRVLPRVVFDRVVNWIDLPNGWNFPIVS